MACAAQRSSRRTDSIENSTKIVYALLERRDAARAIRDPNAASVEEDQARKRRQATHEPRPARVLPGDLDVRHDARHEDEVERTVADNLVRDVHAVRGLRVSNPRYIHDR